MKLYTEILCFCFGFLCKLAFQSFINEIIFSYWLPIQNFSGNVIISHSFTMYTISTFLGINFPCFLLASLSNKQVKESFFFKYQKILQVLLICDSNRLSFIETEMYMTHTPQFQSLYMWRGRKKIHLKINMEVS